MLPITGFNWFICKRYIQTKCGQKHEVLIIIEHSKNINIVLVYDRRSQSVQDTVTEIYIRVMWHTSHTCMCWTVMWYVV